MHRRFRSHESIYPVRHALGLTDPRLLAGAEQHWGWPVAGCGRFAFHRPFARQSPDHVAALIRHQALKLTESAEWMCGNWVKDHLGDGLRKSIHGRNKHAMGLHGGERQDFLPCRAWHAALLIRLKRFCRDGAAKTCLRGPVRVAYHLKNPDSPAKYD